MPSTLSKTPNKLLSVEDELGAPINNNDFGDISDYQYDAIGNLISDSGEEIADIEWTVSGKVKRVKRESGSSKPDLEFTNKTTQKRKYSFKTH